MLPFEFTIEGPPLSHQTKNRQNLQNWKNQVSIAAQGALVNDVDPTLDNVSVTITYYYEDTSPDVDNIIKPIQDALIGIISTRPTSPEVGRIHKTSNQETLSHTKKQGDDR